MPTLILTEAQQAALRSLMALEPWQSLPSADVLHSIETLVPCGVVGLAAGRVWPDRRRREPTPDDMARLALITPLLQRLMGEPPSRPLPSTLTVQERRVLLLVANGMSNAEIATHLFVSVGTVRKHLEHAYRKLGVHNRMAAVVAFEGRTAARPERIDRADKYA
jgi:DNA-binding CsgD family transcriptional regulator